ncbi:MAG: hypothetical protein ACRD0U_02175, partial [Acidimicrobiales bacterium]
MPSDRLPPSQQTAEQSRSLAAYVADELYPFSQDARQRLERAGLGRRGVRRPEDLARVSPVSRPELGTGEGAVLRPSAAALDQCALRWRWQWASSTGRAARFIQEVVDPKYRTIRFLDQDGLLVGSTAADLDKLADLGRRSLVVAGVREGDAVVAFAPSVPDLAFWQLTLGCRDAGVPLAHVAVGSDPASLLALEPTVVAGPADALAGLLDAATQAGHELAGVRLMVVLGQRPGGEDRLRRREQFPTVKVSCGWAPPGVRALWFECAEQGELHTWPDAEVLQSGTDRELVWSPLGWRGTAILRLRTGLRGRVLTDPCPGCGRTTPRLEATADPAYAAALEAHPLVVGWYVERSEHDGDQPVLHVAPASRRMAGRVLHDLGQQLAGVQVVVTSPAALARHAAN